MTALPTMTFDAEVRPFGWLRHSLALGERSLLKIRRTPEALLDVTLQPIIFLLLFVYVFGSAIAGSRHSYLEYLLPGLLVQSMLFGSASIGVNLNTDITKGVSDRFRSLPIARSAPLVGAVLADVLRFAVLTSVVMIAGYAFGFRIRTDALQTLAACLLVICFALCLSWVSVFIGMKARNAGSVQGLTFLIMFPLTFGSSTYVPLNSLPGWLQAFVHVNPANPLVNASRGLMLGGSVFEPVLLSLMWMAIILGIFFPLAVRAYRERV